MDTVFTCPCCGEENRFDHDITRFLRWMKSEDYLQNNHYLQIVEELDLPDPGRMERKKQQQLLAVLFSINEALEDADNKDRKKDLEMKKEKIHNQLRNNF
jgi:hypothetical protein